MCIFRRAAYRILFDENVCAHAVFSEWMHVCVEVFFLFRALEIDLLALFFFSGYCLDVDRARGNI